MSFVTCTKCAVFMAEQSYYQRYLSARKGKKTVYFAIMPQSDVIRLSTSSLYLRRRKSFPD